MRVPVKRQKLYEALKKDIASGFHPAAGILPNEFGLAGKYGYSRDTVRSALSMLEDEKILELMKGKGRRICQPEVEKPQVPLTFLLPCADFLSETFLDVSAQAARRILKGVSQIAFEYDYRVETVPVSPTNNEHDIDWRKLDFVNKDSLVIVSGYWYRDLFQLLMERGCRIAFINQQTFWRRQREDFVRSCFCLTINTVGTTELAVKHLFEHGCRRIALFHHHLSEPEHPVMRGYMSGIAKYGLTFSAWHELLQEQANMLSIKAQLLNFYKKSGSFDGLIIEPNFVLSLQLHNLYQELDLPPNIKIVILGGIENSQRMNPSIISLSLPYEETGRIAAHHLLSQEFRPGEEVIESKLIERESTLQTHNSRELVPA
ncbi:MAG: GntR family transcriptional regulator [Victivallaceae bacterium]